MLWSLPIRFCVDFFDFSNNCRFANLFPLQIFLHDFSIIFKFNFTFFLFNNFFLYKWTILRRRQFFYQWNIFTAHSDNFYDTQTRMSNQWKIKYTWLCSYKYTLMAWIPLSYIYTHFSTSIYIHNMHLMHFIWFYLWVHCAVVISSIKIITKKRTS